MDQASTEGKVKKSKSKQKYKISEVITKKSSRIEPCLAKSHLAGNFHKAKGQLYVETKEDSSKNRILDVHMNKNLLRGISEEQNENSEQTFLGILDKSTGQMKLVEMSSFYVNPLMKKAEFSDEKLSLDELRENVATLGGTRSLKHYKKLKLNKPGEELSEAVLNGINTIDVPDSMEGLTMTDESWKLIVPERDEEANRVEDVYKIEDLIHRDYLLDFVDWSTEALEDDLGDEKYSSYSLLFKTIIAQIKTSFLPKEEQIKKACMAFYLQCLIRFSKMRKSELKGSSPIADCPFNVQQYILKEFSTKHGNFRSKTPVQMDKTTAHILVLALILTEFKLEEATAVQSFGVPEKRLRSIAKAVGARFLKDHIILKLPLDKIRMGYSGRKRKRT